MILKKIISLLFTALAISPCSLAMGAAVDLSLSKNFVKAAADLHMPFIENKGQITDPAVVYVADTFACRVAVTREGQMIYSLPDKPDKKDSVQKIEIKEHLVGADVDVRGRDKQSAKVSYFNGRDPSGWHSNLASYGRVGIGQIEKGIRLELKAYGSNVEKLFYVQPGADPAVIRMAVQGADNLQVGADGELELSTPSGAMRFTKPVAYQQINGTRRMVPVSYNVSDSSYGFELGDYDKSRELVIDPLIRVFPVARPNDTLDLHNAIMDLATDEQGNIYAAGYAHGELAIFKVDSRIEKVLASTTHFSENARYHADIIRSIAVDSKGNVFVAGTTYNPTFPVTEGCHDSRHGNGIDSSEGFVSKLSADLTRLASTYIGGDHYEDIFALVIDKQDRVYVAGSSMPGITDEQRFPVSQGAFDSTQAPIYQRKAVVARLDNSLSEVQAATFLGGNEGDESDKNESIAYRMALDDQGDVWVLGTTTQPDFPVTEGCLGRSYNGDGDLFLSKLNSDLTQLHISTYIGGSDNEAPTDILFDTQAGIYLLGWTRSNNFPMTGEGFSKQYGTAKNGFILKLDTKGERILSSTFLCGINNGSMNGDDVPSAMALSADKKQLVVVGRTESVTFPTTPDCFDSTLHCPDGECGSDSLRIEGTDGKANWGDGFISVISSDLNNLVYSTFIGGNDTDYFDAVLINGNDIIVAGETQSGRTFPMVDVPKDDYTAMGMLLRFNENETPEGSNKNNSETQTGGPLGNGGGGGCLISSCLQ